MTKENIIKILKDNEQLLSKYNIRKIGLFGSFVRGEQGKDSDVDFLVEFVSPISILKHVNLIFELEELLGLKVDVVTPNALKPLLRENILKEVIEIEKL